MAQMFQALFIKQALNMSMVSSELCVLIADTISSLAIFPRSNAQPSINTSIILGMLG